MGQTIGRAPMPKRCRRFINLPRSCVYDLWEAFNDIAEGFGLTIEEFQEIIKSALMDFLSITERQLNLDAESVFRAFDDDENSLVDSLEFISSFAMMSGMTPEEKIRFIFAMYDFDESGVLTLDEMVLALRSSLSGLSKLSKISPPTEPEIENIVVLAFDAAKQSSAKSANLENKGIDRESFVKFCINNPEIISWTEYFDDLEEYDDERSKTALPTIEQIPAALQRSARDENEMNPAFEGKKSIGVENLPSSTRMGWQNIVPILAPAKSVETKLGLPQVAVDLDWIYGFNGHSSKQCVYYTARGAMIYPAGSMIIVQDIAKHEQTYFGQHTDLVLCVKCAVLQGISDETDIKSQNNTISSTSDQNSYTLVASGECGIRPSVHIWVAETKELLSTLRGFHKNGIKQLDFSPDQTKIAILGMDSYHCLAVYNWKRREMLWASRTLNSVVHDVRFLSNVVIGTCGQDHVIFWRESVCYTSSNQKTTPRITYKRYRGQFGTAFVKETQLCIGAVRETVFTCSQSGMIYIWEGRNVVKAIKGHTGTINACFTVNQAIGQVEKGLVTVCSSGKIQIWNEKIELGATFNAVSLGAIESSITSVCYDNVASKLLLGFRTGEIFEMDSTDGRNLHSGAVTTAPFNNRVCGLASHPLNSSIFCVVGDDRTVRIFDAEQRKQLRVCLLDTIGHCCTYSPDGHMIVIGLGSGIDGKEEKKEGAFIVISHEDLTLLHESRDSKCLISDCKFSANGEKLAMASHDGSIYIYNTKKFHSKAKCRGHSGKVEHIDFSSNGSYLMSNCSSGDLLFWDSETGELQNPKTVKSLQWIENSCIYSYATQGLWSESQSVLYTATCKSNSAELLVAVDMFGKVKLTNFPCLSTSNDRNGINFLERRGHSKTVANCKFSCDDKLLFTCGETDGAVFQWRIKKVTDIQNYNEMQQEAGSIINQAEMAFDGKILNRTPQFEDMISGSVLPLCEMEEGLTDNFQLHPWQKSVVPPSRVPFEDNSEPSDHLNLEFVYGFASDFSRQSLFYSPARSEIAFFSSSVVTSMNQKLRTQSFYNQHTCKITAMAVNKVSGVIATGDWSMNPAIRVWNPENMEETYSVLEGFHRRAINHLKFSVDGRLLVSVGQDDFHSIAVYDWKNKVILSFATSFENKSLWIDINPNGTCLVHCGHQIVRFWEIKVNHMNYVDAVFGNRAKLQSYLCCGWIGGSSVVGTADGNLYRFNGIKLDSIVQAHSGPVNSISSSSDGICTGSADGFVKVWTRFLECRLVVDLKNLRSISAHVCSVDWDYDGGRILIGTKNSEIFEVSAGDGENLHRGPLLEGHGGDELWGLSANPMKDEFCTVGDDALLRVWNLFEHAPATTVALEMPARCCCYSPDGKSIAIGFGCPKKVSNRQFDGKWIVLDTEDYQVSHEARDSTKWITDIKYSPNGELIAMGSYDNKVYIYGVLSGYALNAVVSQHQSFIISLDFSEDSQWLRSNCGGLELNYFEADTGLYIPAASKLRDIVWSTQNCMMGWSVQGIWPPHKDGTELTACDSNLFRGVEDGAVVAAGDNYGRIRLFRYPCTSSFAVSNLYWASSSPITRLRFASGDAFLISLNGADKTIMQWAHTRDRDDEVAFDTTERRGKLEEDEDDIARLFGMAGASTTGAIVGEKADTGNEGLNKLVSTRPWLASIVAPTDAKEKDVDVNKKPPANLLIAHIISMQIARSRSSVLFNTVGDVVYPASKYVCVYSKKLNSQLHYRRHAEEISCIAVSKDGVIAASAERSNRPQIHIWDANTCQDLCTLPTFHRRGVASMEFSKSRKLLVTVGQDQDNSIALWFSSSGAWIDAKLFASAKGDVHPVLYCSFYSGDGTGDGFVLGSGGRFHQKFWKLKGKCLTPCYAEYDKKHKIGTLLCGKSMKNNFISGSTSGHLFVWEGRKLQKMIKAHDLGVTCVWSSDNQMISTGKDGTIKMWSSEFEHIRSFSLSDADVPPVSTCIRSLDAMILTAAVSTGSANSVIPTLNANKILVATSSSELYEISVPTGSICMLQESHYEGELWGLAVHPFDPDVFVTTGDDKTIRVWSISARRLLRKALIDCTSRSVGWSPDGKLLIVGMGGTSDGKRQRKDGAFLLIDADTLKPLFEGRDSRHWIPEIKFSPDGKSFALGSMDHKIYIYNRDTFRLKGTCDRHNSFVKGFDFSRDSVYIQSDSGDYEHLYFEAEDGQHFSAGSQLRDIKWYDWTCVYGWPVQGIWPHFRDVENETGFDPTTVHKNPKAPLLAAGDTSGSIKLYNYPCISKESVSFKYDAHNKEVSKLKFSCDGRYMISLGKYDRSIMIWNVISDR